MIQNKNQSVVKRVIACVKKSIPQGTKTALWILKLTIPITFAVFLLDVFGILNMIAGVVAPFLNYIGLSGQASIVLITSFFTNIYSVIAVMTTLGVDHREGTILAVMCLISHALVVETAIQKRTGSSPRRMVFIRLAASFISAYFLNLFLPGENLSLTGEPVLAEKEFTSALISWSADMAVTTIKIIVLVNILLIFQRILQEFNLIRWILLPFKPVLKFMGLPSNTGFLWMVAYTLGLSYGGAIMISEAEEGNLSPEDADLLNHHIAISHSQLEDPLLFVAIGYGYGILIFPRIILSCVFVWLRRLELRLKIKLALR